MQKSNQQIKHTLMHKNKCMPITKIIKKRNAITASTQTHTQVITDWAVISPCEGNQRASTCALPALFAHDFVCTSTLARRKLVMARSWVERAPGVNHWLLFGGDKTQASVPMFIPFGVLWKVEGE